MKSIGLTQVVTNCVGCQVAVYLTRLRDAEKAYELSN
jgi:hypothetical protein